MLVDQLLHLFNRAPQGTGFQDDLLQSMENSERLPGMVQTVSPRPHF